MTPGSENLVSMVSTISNVTESAFSYLNPHQRYTVLQKHPFIYALLFLLYFVNNKKKSCNDRFLPKQYSRICCIIIDVLKEEFTFCFVLVPPGRLVVVAVDQAWNV